MRSIEPLPRTVLMSEIETTQDRYQALPVPISSALPTRSLPQDPRSVELWSHCRYTLLHSHRDDVLSDRLHEPLSDDFAASHTPRPRQCAGRSISTNYSIPTRSIHHKNR